jgi:hypothetical protein
VPDRADRQPGFISDLAQGGTLQAILGDDAVDSLDDFPTAGFGVLDFWLTPFLAQSCHKTAAPLRP